MAYYGSGYLQGISRDFNPLQGSPQSALIPAGYANNQLPQAPTTSSTSSSQSSTGTPSVADSITGNPLATLLNKPLGGAINESQKMGQLPAWASQYIQDSAGGANASSGMLHDAYYSAAPTLQSIYNQYGAGFDPSKFTGLGNGSLYGLQNSLQHSGYGLGNIGGYYQDSVIKGSLMNPSSLSGAGLTRNGSGTQDSIGGITFDDPYYNLLNNAFGTGKSNPYQQLGFYNTFGQYSPASQSNSSAVPAGTLYRNPGV